MYLRRRFANNLQMIRKELGFTQYSLSKSCGISISKIGNIENGRTSVTIDNLEVIAKALDVDPCILLGRWNIKFHNTGLKRSITNPLDFKKGQVALCMWSDKGMEFHPIYSTKVSLSQNIYSLLQANGYYGKKLLDKIKSMNVPTYFR